MAPGSANPLADYDARIACVDTAADDAPVPVTGSRPSWSVSDLAAGQVVRCTITNTPRTGERSVTTCAVPAQPTPTACTR